MSKLAGKVAVVTGSGRGIGAAIAIRYAQEGAKVVVCDIDGDNANAVAERIKADGGEAIAVKTDVSTAGRGRRADRGHRSTRSAACT